MENMHKDVCKGLSHFHYVAKDWKPMWEGRNIEMAGSFVGWLQ